MPHNTFLGKKLPASVRAVAKALHGNPVKEFRKDTTKIKDKIIERATGVPPPVREKPRDKKKKPHK